MPPGKYLESNMTSNELFLQPLFPNFKQRQQTATIYFPDGIYLLKVNNRNTRTRCEICSKLRIKTPERQQWRHFGVFIVNFEHISFLVSLFLLLTLKT